jgi:hypothetical protein
MNIFGPDTVMVRIHNYSEYTAKNITVNGIAFEDLKPGEFSEYIDVQDLLVSDNYVMSSYDAELVEINIPKHKCALCGGGVEHLANGRYTLEFNVIGGNKEEGSRRYISLTVQPAEG